jgi:acetyl esterase/lipase
MKCIVGLFFLFISTNANSQSMKINLWPDGKIPLNFKTDIQEVVERTDIVRISKVQAPQLEVFLPNKKGATGQAVIICPGGGYSKLAYDWEGTDIAKLFNAHGIAAFVLKYRLPDSLASNHPDQVPLLDAKQAMQIVRTRAAEWNINPQKIGIMGFSAGGHLAATLSTHFDQISRPDFSILIYPVITMDKNMTHMGSRNNLIGTHPTEALIKLYSNELQITAQTPPTFILHATDDNAVPVENSLNYYQGLKNNGVPAEMHIFPSGGHGFALALGKGALEKWPELLLNWMKELK